MQTEKHPLQPFLPDNAKILMLGSFPPKREKWSMEFFYPNWINDMWRIMGVIFFKDKHFFEKNNQKCFEKNKIINFCTQNKIALYDTAYEVRRLKDNASDKFLEIVTNTNIPEIFAQIPMCKTIVTTGQKATDIITETFQCSKPNIGEMVQLSINNKAINFWRMPSSSRAYPLSLEKKAEYYCKMFKHEQIYTLK